MSVTFNFLLLVFLCVNFLQFFCRLYRLSEIQRRRFDIPRPSWNSEQMPVRNGFTGANKMRPVKRDIFSHLKIDPLGAVDRFKDTVKDTFDAIPGLDLGFNYFDIFDWKIAKTSEKTDLNPTKDKTTDDDSVKSDSDKVPEKKSTSDLH